MLLIAIDPGLDISMGQYLLQETLPLIASPLVQGHQLNQLNQLGIDLDMLLGMLIGIGMLNQLLLDLLLDKLLLVVLLDLLLFHIRQRMLKLPLLTLLLVVVPIPPMMLLVSLDLDRMPLLLIWF
jgi:hypothetical protein